MLTKLSTGRICRADSSRRRFANLTLAVFLLAGTASAAQEASQADGFLLGAFFKTQNLIDKAAADLEKVDREIQENDRVIKKAEEIITLARQRDNKPAESAARDALLNARAAKKKNEETRARLELVRNRAVASLGAIQNRLAFISLDPGPKPQVRGLVSNFSGRVQVSKKNGESFDLTSSDIGLLETGDSISTYGASSVEIQTLDGRGTVQLGEYSELKLQEDTPEKQVVELVRGKIYSAVDKVDDFVNMLQDKSERYADKLATIDRQSIDSAIAATKKWANRKLEVRTTVSCGGVRGTKFSVELKNGEETEFAVYEGAVDVSDLKGENTVLVEEGFKVIVTKAGISEPAKIADIDKWWEK